MSFPCLTTSTYFVDHSRQETQPKCFLEFFEREMFTDVTVQLSDESVVKCHKMMLCASSPVFRNMFLGDYMESRVNIIDMTEDESDIVRQVIRYMYTRTIQMNKHNILSIQEFAHKYQMTDLLEACSTALSEMVYMGNVSFLANYSFLYDLKTLQQKCTTLLLRNLQQCLSEADKKVHLMSLDFEVLCELLSKTSMSDVDICILIAEWCQHQHTTQLLPYQALQEMLCVLLQKFVKQLPHLELIIQSHDYLRENSFIMQMKEHAQQSRLSDIVEMELDDGECCVAV